MTIFVYNTIRIVILYSIQGDQLNIAVFFNSHFTEYQKNTAMLTGHPVYYKELLF